MSDIPPPAISLVPQALAVPVTSFVGREPEIALVAALLVRPDVRLVTLTGPGGVGKTRLALQVAHTARGLFADGVVFVDLSPVRDAALVLPTIAAVLGVLETGNAPAGRDTCRRPAGPAPAAGPR